MAKHPPQQPTANPPPEGHKPAETLGKNETENETIVAANNASRAGLADPTPSVRKEFEEHAKTLAQEPAEEQEAPYRGPWLVRHTFKYTDPSSGAPVTIKPTRPAVGGGQEIRVIHPGDIPDSIAQEAWAEGALEWPKPVAPQPKRPRLAQAR